MAHVDDCDILQWEIAKLEKENAELKKGLRFYAERSHYYPSDTMISAIDSDEGERAQRLLVKYGGEEW